MGILVKMAERAAKKKAAKLPKTQPYSCAVYKVRGINPQSGRRKTVEVVEASNAPADLIQSKSGLLPPYEVEDATRPMSEAQREVMLKHGFCPPEGLAMCDAGIFITRSVEGEELIQPVAPLTYIDFAIKHGVCISKYASEKEAREYLTAALPELSKEIKKL